MAQRPMFPPGVVRTNVASLLGVSENIFTQTGFKDQIPLNDSLEYPEDWIDIASDWADNLVGLSVHSELRVNEALQSVLCSTSAQCSENFHEHLLKVCAALPTFRTWRCFIEAINRASPESHGEAERDCPTAHRLYHNETGVPHLRSCLERLGAAETHIEATVPLLRIMLDTLRIFGTFYQKLCCGRVTSEEIATLSRNCPKLFRSSRVYSELLCMAYWRRGDQHPLAFAHLKAACRGYTQVARLAEKNTTTGLELLCYRMSLPMSLFVPYVELHLAHAAVFQLTRKDVLAVLTTVQTWVVQLQEAWKRMYGLSWALSLWALLSQGPEVWAGLALLFHLASVLAKNENGVSLGEESDSCASVPKCVRQLENLKWPHLTLYLEALLAKDIANTGQRESSTVVRSRVLALLEHQNPEVLMFLYTIAGDALQDLETNQTFRGSCRLQVAWTSEMSQYAAAQSLNLLKNMEPAYMDCLKRGRYFCAESFNACCAKSLQAEEDENFDVSNTTYTVDQIMCMAKRILKGRSAPPSTTEAMNANRPWSALPQLIDQLNDAYNADPTATNTAHAYALALFHSHRYWSCVCVLDKALYFSPHEPELRYLKALCHLQMHRIDLPCPKAPLSHTAAALYDLRCCQRMLQGTQTAGTGPPETLLSSLKECVEALESKQPGLLLIDVNEPIELEKKVPERLIEMHQQSGSGSGFQTTRGVEGPSEPLPPTESLQFPFSELRQPAASPKVAAVPLRLQTQCSCYRLRPTLRSFEQATEKWESVSWRRRQRTLDSGPQRGELSAKADQLIYSHFGIECGNKDVFEPGNSIPDLLRHQTAENRQERGGLAMIEGRRPDQTIPDNNGSHPASPSLTASPLVLTSSQEVNSHVEHLDEVSDRVYTPLTD